MATKTAEEKMEAARCQLLIEWELFGSLITYLDPEEKGDFPELMGTDGERIAYNPEKVEDTSLDEVIGSCAHEVLHNALGHLWRRGDRDKKKWNIATDHVVNLIVRESFSLPDWVLCDPQYEEKSAEEVYGELPDQPDQAGSSPQCPECGSESLRGEIVERVGPNKYKVEVTCQDCGYKEEQVRKLEEGDSASDEGEGTIPAEWRTIDDHGEWDQAGQESGDGEEKKGDEQGGGTSGEGEKSGPSTDKDMTPEDLEEEWKRRAARVAESAKSQGDLPGGLERLVEDLLYPEVDWRTQLRRYVTTLAEGMRENWARQSRRTHDRSYYFPDDKENQLEIAFAVDTSGSVSDDELQDFLSEIKGALDSFPSFKVRLLACDAALHTAVTAESTREFEDFIDETQGRGGTDFRPVFKRLEKERVKALVYLTDGRGTFPDSMPHYDILWIINNEEVDPPWGRTIRLTD